MKRKQKFDYNQLDLWEAEHQKELLARGKEFGEELQKELKKYVFGGAFSVKSPKGAECEC